MGVKRTWQNGDGSDLGFRSHRWRKRISGAGQADAGIKCSSPINKFIETLTETVLDELVAIGLLGKNPDYQN